MWRLFVRGLAFLLLLVALAAPVVAQPAFDALLERPIAGETVSGIVNVIGWAVDPIGIARVDLIVDGQFFHSANLKIPRIDVIEAHPSWSGFQNILPGFQTAFSASRLSNGPHLVRVRIVTEDNRVVEIGERTIIVDNTINQPPFGFVDTPDTQGIYDLQGVFPVTGWAADLDGVQRVDILLNGGVVQAAVHGDLRPDVAGFFPDFPGAAHSGFIAHVDSTRFLDGVHTLTVQVVDRRGMSRTIGRRTVQIFNSTNNLRPFGFLDQPLRDQVIVANCGSLVPPISPVPPARRPLLAVRGWALDVGSRSDLGRVSYVELMLDGVRRASTDDCAYDPDFDTLVNCYGLPRFDVAKYFPTYPDSPRSGFLFGLDVGRLIEFGGVREGNHVIKIRVGDQEQTFADIPNTSGIPVFFRCLRDRFQFAPIGYIDFPGPLDYVTGEVTFFGWAAEEFTDIARIEVVVDGITVGTAQHGFLRTDVQSAFPFFFSARNSGWRFTFDTRQIADSRHRLTVIAIDRDGNRVEIGSRDFFSENARP